MKKIEVISIDRIGLVGEISKILSRVNGNIITHTANVSSDGTTAVSHFIADVDLNIEIYTISNKQHRTASNMPAVRSNKECLFKFVEMIFQ